MFLRHLSVAMLVLGLSACDRTPEETDTDTDTDTPPDDGWAGAIDTTVVNLTSTPYDFDAGVGALVAAAGSDGDTSTVDLTVSGAIVTNLGYPTAMNIWFADGTGAMRTYLYEELVPAPAIGDKVSFHVTEIKNYHGELEVTGLDSFAIDSSGNDIYVRELGVGDSLDAATMARTNVHVWGEITADNGYCGTTTKCFDFTHGGVVDNFRVSEDKGVLVGDLVDVVAPVSVYDSVLIDITNWDWMRWY